MISIDESSLDRRLEFVKSSLIERELIVKNSIRALEDKKKEFEQCQSKLRLLQESKEFLEALAEEKEKEFIPKIQGIVQYSLDSIYGKGAFDFRVKMSIKGGRKSMDMGIVKNGEFVDIIESNGGALVEIVAFILHICVVLISGVRRFVFSDEKFTFMDSNNSLRFCSFLSQLAEKLEMTIVIITHIQHIAESFPHRYRLIPTTEGVKVEKF